MRNVDGILPFAAPFPCQILSPRRPVLLMKSYAANQQIDRYFPVRVRTSPGKPERERLFAFLGGINQTGVIEFLARRNSPKAWARRAHYYILQ